MFVHSKGEKPATNVASFPEPNCGSGGMEFESGRSSGLQWTPARITSVVLDSILCIAIFTRSNVF
jgi:hypothetical protein